MTASTATRRRFLSGAARAAGAAALLRWLGPQGAEAAREHAAAQKLSGTLSIFDFGQLSTPGTQKNIVKAYEALHPGVKINIISAPSGIDNTTYTITQLTAGSAPDIVSVAVAQEPWSDLTRGWWEELTDFVHQPNPYDPGHRRYVDVVRPVYLDQLQLNNRFWGVAITGLDAMIFYNKALFRKAGIEAPPATWADFITAQQKLKKIGVVPMAVDAADITYGDPFPSLPDLVQSQVMAKTIEKIHKGPGVVTLNELVTAIENGTFSARNPDYRDSFRLLKDWSAYWQPGAVGTQSQTIFNLFFKQKAAMAYVGAYFVPTIESSVPKGQAFAWDVMPFPQITPASSPYATAGAKNTGVWGAWGSGAYCISYVAAKRGNAALARDFLFFLTLPRQDATIALSDGFLTTYKGIAIQGYNELERAMYTKFDHDMQHPCALATALTALGPGTQVARTKMVQAYVSGQTSLDGAMSQMESALTRAARQARQWLAVAGMH